MKTFLALAVLIFAVFCLMFVLMEAGRRLGMRQRKLDAEGAKAGVGTVDGAVFGLLGLLLAFTFAGAATRYDAKRELIVQETNAIGTAYLRIDLLPQSAQPALRDDFRNYLDSRIVFYRKLMVDPFAAMQEMDRYAALQNKIWSEALAGCRELGSPAVTSLVVSSLNEMFDITTTRAAALETHPPTIVYVGLAILMLASALLAGYGMAEGKRPSRFHMILYPLVLATAVLVIIDIEFPRTGFVRIERADHFLTDLRTTMK
jgi:hypothetical protein